MGLLHERRAFGVVTTGLGRFDQDKLVVSPWAISTLPRSPATTATRRGVVSQAGQDKAISAGERGYTGGQG